MDTSDRENEYEVYEFGWWPEIIGVLGVFALLWYLITFARGSI